MSSPILRAAICALPASLSLIAGTVRADDEILSPVVVTATRFATPDPRIPANISVITKEDIRNTPGLSLPDVLATRAGVNVVPLYGPLGIDATVDIGGFGATATSNTLILVDGQRINPLDSGSIVWSAIPLASIERIEIMRGSGTVLYGDGASGGVINIITDKSGKPGGSVTATLGSYNFRGLDASVATGNDRAYFNLFARYADTDGYRHNNWQDQQTASGRAGLKLERGEIFTDYAVYKEASGLPGNLLSAGYRTNPRNATTPNDNQFRDGYRLRPGFSYGLTDALTLEGEVSVEQQNLHSNYYASNYISDRNRDMVSFTPRLRWRHGLGRLDSETVVGMDYYDGKVGAQNQGGPNQNARQTSTAFYFQNSTDLISRLSLTLGGRTQRVRQSASQDAYPAWFQPAVNGSATRTRNAYDIGLAYAGDGWRVYGKTGTTFRFANLDELFGYDNVLLRPVFAGNLRPQHGTIQEVGGSLKSGAWSGRLSLSRLDLTDEIGYDAGTGANANFSPTRRDSANLEVEWQATERWSSRLAYSYLDATFRSGSYAGKTVPLAARDQASLQVTWKGGQIGTYTAAARYVGDRPYGSDFTNTQSRLAGYTTLDLQGAWKIDRWTVTAKLLNALDKKYAPFAGYSSFKHDTYYYPADGRTAYVSARYDF
ncbi:TonB-dependent receptor [Oryzomicrobium sp.]|uniref:TonB-dependent receptor n=1 Tax=Oryzomicrobium sp. TaxID=1911578 RepID=UPI002FE2F28B